MSVTGTDTDASLVSRMTAFEVEYDFYFKNNHGMFLVQSQIKNLELSKIKRGLNIDDLLRK